MAQHPLDDALDEIEIFGFPLCNIFELVDAVPADFLQAAELYRHAGEQVSVLGWLVTSKAVNTITRQTMHFHTFLDSHGDWLDVIFFPETSGNFPLQEKAVMR